MAVSEVEAKVLSVVASGESGSYQLAVEISSPDLGCEQYADWWEVVTSEGELLYRRVLLHSHVTEQPFTRSGGPIGIDSNQLVRIRLHMNNSGYSALAFEGSVEDGFIATELPVDFAKDLSSEQPLPEDCAF